MTLTPSQPDALSDLRQRYRAEDGVFWIDDNEFAAFDPQVALALDTANFEDLALPDKLSDAVRGRQSEPVFWQEVRAGWLTQARRLGEAPHTTTLSIRMRELLDASVDQARDLVWVAQEVVSRSLVPSIIDGLGARDLKRVHADLDLKIRYNLETWAPSWRRSWGTTWIQLCAGWVVRREIQQRARGRRPARVDFTQPIVELLPRLGIGRGVDAVTGVLTAISGPPGTAAACSFYAMARYPEWTKQIQAELVEVEEAELFASPMRAAPRTHRFIREVLRMWSPTPIMQRTARKDLEYAGGSVRAGQSYFLGPDLLHHDPKYWPDPDIFDPDRWLPGAERGPSSTGCYAPFSWAPRGCVGAGLGTAQLILLCHLVCKYYRLELKNPAAIGMAMPSMPVPQNFHGVVRRVQAV